MARRVFFAFHYQQDVWRVNQVRNANVVAGPDQAGFYDHSEYEDANRLGTEGIRRLILRHLDNTTVTVVLIGQYTAARPWVRYELSESIGRRNGLLGIYIHHLRTPHDPLRTLLTGFASLQLPSKPWVPPEIPFPAYSWDGDVRRFAAAIEEAGKRADAWRNPPSTFRR